MAGIVRGNRGCNSRIPGTEGTTDCAVRCILLAQLREGARQGGGWRGRDGGREGQSGVGEEKSRSKQG